MNRLEEIEKRAKEFYVGKFSHGPLCSDIACLLELVEIYESALEKYANPETHSMDENGFVWSGDYFDYETAQRALTQGRKIKGKE